MKELHNSELQIVILNGGLGWCGGSGKAALAAVFPVTVTTPIMKHGANSTNQSEE
jgi:hypothetical protein